ncbi:TonB-dependent receptor [Phenylobacterium sp.]|uniref:TonB-dependent receptor family protein n=1 Tax=Phenylobacterium sp. TaxID=1871053 RepID=UPI00281151C7|nr:TonB-dependent receptor [Phenylobacterium sp.]
MSLKRRALQGALLLGAAWPALAHAREAPASVETVIVTARPDPDDPAVVRDARRRLSESPGAVSVIAQESFERRFSVALDDVLRDTPGVFAQKKWGGDVRISIRGSGLGNANHNRGLLIAQDGVPLNEADGFGDSQAADPLNTRFVEVYRGGNALRFGGALLGGAINMVTPTGRTAGFETRVRVDGGSFGLLREHVAVAGEFGDWDVYVSGTNQTGQGWRPQSQQNLQFGALNVGRSFGEDREVRFIVNGSNIKQEIPGALTRAQFEADPRQAAPGNYANDQGRDQRGLRASLRTRWRLNPGAVFEGAVYGVWKDLDHPIFQVIDQESRNWGAFGRIDWDGEIAGRRADAFGGVWLRTGDLDSNFYRNLKGARGAPTSRTLQNADAVDVFGEARIFVSDRLALVGGATWGKAWRDYRSLAVPGTDTRDFQADKTYDWIAPRVGLLWEDEGGAQVFANLTRSVEPPNLSSMSPTNAGFAPVKAQKAWTAEVGTRGRKGPLTWDLTVYRAWLKDELLQYVVDADTPASTFNADETVHQGLEAAVDWQVTPSLRLRQSWTWSDFRFVDDGDYQDNRLPIVPEHLYRAELRYEHLAGWWIAPSLEWQASKAWVDFENTTRTPAYAVWSLGGGWRASDRVSLFVDIRNVADKTYISNVQAQVEASGASAAYWPGDGRSVFGGITWTY